MTPPDQHLAATSGICRLLARIVLRELDKDLANQLRKSDVGESLLQIGGVLPPNDDGGLEELAADYCQLFIGPSGHLPPYQSVWEQGQFQSSSVASMKDFANLFAVPRRGWPDGVMSDHLGIQLEIFADILADLAERREPDERREVQGLADAFLHRHLSWPGPFLRTAAQRAETDFYRAILHVTADVLESL